MMYLPRASDYQVTEEMREFAERMGFKLRESYSLITVVHGVTHVKVINKLAGLESDAISNRIRECIRLFLLGRKSVQINNKQKKEN